MIHLIVAFQIAVTAGAPAAGRADSVALVRHLQQDAGEFLWVWRFYWEASEALRHNLEGSLFPQSWEPRVTGLSDRVMRDRVNHLHCHPDSRGGFPVLPTIIRENAKSLRAVCPVWLLPRPAVHDERISLDDALTEPLRSGIRMARAGLIDSLERASLAVPGDAWLAGQRVRFAVDQRDSAAAFRAVADCRVSTWWCTALEGYARYEFGTAAEADSVFMLAVNALSPRDRCAWTDVSRLLDESGRSAFAGTTCEKRDSVLARFWWLSDPLYSERGNERRAEHYARIVMIGLRGDVPPTDRWNWQDGEGGASLREMLARYGWPSQSWWSGPREDRSHYSYLGVMDDRIRAAGVFTTAEYSTDRFHTVPDWSAVADPWHARPSAWDVAAPRDGSGRPDLDWWPQEHYARRNGALLSIVEQQTAILRRDDDLQLAIAADLRRVVWRLDRPPADTTKIALIVTRSPDSLRIWRQTVPRTDVVISRAAISSAPAIVGLEAATTEPGASTGRIRFGIAPPEPLSAMRRGEIAISEPVLVRAAANGARPTSEPSAALASMLGTTRLVGVERVGVYWETYGIAANDSVDVSVRIDRLGTAGFLRRLGTVLHLADRVDGSATIRWKEPQSVLATTTIAGRVPIQGRNVTIDLTRLVPDRYSVTVSVSRSGGQTATASREFEIVK
ncbi:MAG TPA: hypothetical protein VIP11_06980 [Gemmatimonadaceae bacterium]